MAAKVARPSAIVRSAFIVSVSDCRLETIVNNSAFVVLVVIFSCAMVEISKGG